MYVQYSNFIVGNLIKKWYEQGVHCFGQYISKSGQINFDFHKCSDFDHIPNLTGISKISIDYEQTTKLNPHQYCTVHIKVAKLEEKILARS